MTPNNALAVREQSNLMAFNNDPEIEKVNWLAKAFSSSGYFQDAQEVPKAVVKILYGQELGLSPAASMSGVHIVKGKPVLGANMIATLIKKSNNDFKVVELTAEKCTLHFFKKGEYKPNAAATFSVETFTIDDAKQAELLGNAQWKKYPRNMLFARAVSNGARFFCPEIFGGVPVYTPEELGAKTDSEGDFAIDPTDDYSTAPPPKKNIAPQNESNIFGGEIVEEIPSETKTPTPNKDAALGAIPNTGVLKNRALINELLESVGVDPKASLSRYDKLKTDEERDDALNKTRVFVQKESNKIKANKIDEIVKSEGWGLDHDATQSFFARAASEVLKQEVEPNDFDLFKADSEVLEKIFSEINELGF